MVEDKVTCEQINLQEDDVLMAMGAGTGARIIPKEWIRSKRHYPEGQFSMRQQYYDAICFLARGDTKICGFMYSNVVYNKDCSLMVNWCVDDEEFTEDREFVITGTDGLGEDNYRRFDFQDYGIKPISLSERQKITFRARCPTNGVYFGYISSGYPDRYDSIEGQEHMFHTNSSNHN